MRGQRKINIIYIEINNIDTILKARHTNYLVIGGMMKDSPLKVLAFKTIILSILGLSTLPFLSIIVQYIDSVTGFSLGSGYHADNIDYIFESPLVYIGVVFCINIVLAMIYLIYCYLKEKQGDSE